MQSVLSAGYFRLQEWEEIGRLGHKYDVPIWTSLDEVCTDGPNANSLAAYRAGAMNMWNAGVDGIYLFNFSPKPPEPKFELSQQIGDPATMTFQPKTHVADARGQENSDYWLRGAEQYVTKKSIRDLPHQLVKGQPKSVTIFVGNDLAAAKAIGRAPAAKVRAYHSALLKTDDLSLEANERECTRSRIDPELDLVEFHLPPECVKKGFNRFELTLTAEQETEVVLEDLQLWLRYGR